MSIPLITIIIVTRNSKRFMTACLDSLLNQTRRDFQIIVIDNDSSDGTVEFIRREFPMVSVVENNKNLGFAKANNHGIRLFKSPYIVLCNPDIVLEQDWLEKMMAAAQDKENLSYSVFGGKLLKLKLLNAEIGEMEKMAVVDSCGLKVLKNHRVVEWGAGEPSEKFNQKREIFGVGGALVLFKREVLENSVLIDKYHPQGDYFDGSFFFYVEDVDLAWRLRLLGQRAIFIPEAIAYHLRTFSGSEKHGLAASLQNRRRQNNLAKYYSYRNHLLLLFTDEYLSNLLIFAPRILWLELRKLVYLLFFEFRNLYALIEITRMLPEIISKRKYVFGRARATAKEMRKWYE